MFVVGDGLSKKCPKKKYKKITNKGPVWKTHLWPFWLFPFGMVKMVLTIPNGRNLWNGWNECLVKMVLTILNGRNGWNK